MHYLTSNRDIVKVIYHISINYNISSIDELLKNLIQIVRYINKNELNINLIYLSNLYFQSLIYIGI